jgi:hypothetical protein
MEHPMMSDENLEKLEAQLAAFKGKPSNRMRWTRALIERLRVSELAAQYLLDGMPAKGRQQAWQAALADAADALRVGGRIRRN